MSLNYSYKHDISYANYNNSNLPWKINSSYIYHNNQTINSSLNLGPINNNLVIESSQNNIVLVTPQNNKQVIVNNNMTINNNLDISNILKTNFINANDLCSNGIIHTTGLTIKGSINMLGKFKYRRGAIDISVGDTSASETRFRGVNFNNSFFYDSSINNSTILTSDFSNMNIFNSYIYNTPIGYDKSNNSNPAKAVFSDVLLYNLLLDTSTNAKCYIKFSNSNYNSNYNTPIIIKSSDDYAKLEISKPLNIGPSQINTNISNISVFNGDISCEKLYYSQLFPDVKLNNYFDISIGQVSVSGNVIPSVNNRFNIGSTNLKFNEITSANFFGFLDGSCSLANDLIKNLDMSFNNLDIGGTITLNKQNLAQFLSGDLKTIASSISDFSNANRSLLDLSISLYSKSDFDLCLNTHITKRSLLESSFSRLTNDVTNISNSVYSKSDFDLCLNRNLLRINDLSAIVSVVSSPPTIYPNLSYLNSSLVKVNSAKVSDELVFPYAITYIDDNVEDTNIKEAYSYRMTTTETTITRTSAFDTTTPYTYPIVDAEPDDGEMIVVMQAVTGQMGTQFGRTWTDRNGLILKPAVYRATPAISSGGTIIINSGFICHVFTESGKFVPRFSGTIEALLVGGGGGGDGSFAEGRPGGGGGGGGVVVITSTSVTAGQAYAINVGNGGGPATNGSDTTAFNARAAGGGRGVVRDGDVGISGGCGGGVGGWEVYNAGGLGGVGNFLGLNNTGTTHGGNGGNSTSFPTSHSRGSGGGGAGGNAQNTTLGTDADSGYNGSGSGGIGYTSNILGTNYTFGGGGGGGAQEGSYAPFIRPVGGYGGSGGGGGGAGQEGGGLGGANTYSTPGQSGGNRLRTAGGNGGINSGGGGGGSSGGPGGSGGSGIVIIRYSRNTTTIGGTGSYSYILDDNLLSWEQHRTRSGTISANGVTCTFASISSDPDNDAVGIIASTSVKQGEVYIGARRKANSSATGRSANDWEWVDNSPWNYEYFYRGIVQKTAGTPYDSTTRDISTISGQPVIISNGGIIDFSDTNVKLSRLVCSNNSSIVVTATSISTLSIPSNPAPSNGAENRISSNTSSALEYTDYRITTTTQVHQYITTTITYSRVTGLATGSFKISENSNNNSNYSDLSFITIPTSYSCIAITNDGMFVALGKASDVTVYMRTSSTWITLGSPISINFSAYTNTDVGIIPTQFTENWRKNLQNLAINYISGSTNPTIFLAFGDTRNVIKVYSYSGGTWSLTNGFYSVAGGSWGSDPLTSYSASVLGVSTSTNFGYFVILSQSPSVLGFSVDDKFYTYNCTTTNNTIRGSRQTLQASHNNYKNIIAFKMTSNAEKIIVSNTYYVFIYNWSATNWTSIRTINYVSSAITFTYPNTSTTPIPAGPRSLDISNISANECVFAIGFPDVLIDISVNRKARGYVEYWKLTDSSLNRLATLMPRKRDFNNSSVDSDEYFFSAGGIKITNANTIIVAPNFKFHFNGTTKKYELDPRIDSWTTHNSRATSSRFLASIQNEVENELVKISARNNNVWIGGKRLTNPPIPNDGAGGKTSRNWEWITGDAWNYQNFASGQPNALLDTGLEFSGNGWNDLGMSNNRQAIFFNTTTNYSSKNTFSIFNNFFFHSSGFSSTYFPTDISTTVMARWYSRDTSLNPTNTNTIHFTAGGRIVSLTRKILTLSDIRLKENIVDTTPKLEDLLKVRVVNYSLKGSNGAKLIGVVAQELEQLFPSLVNNGELSPRDIILGKTESYKSVKYSCFDVILIKAFQEQMAIINKLSLQLYELECKTNILKTICQDYVVLTQDLDLLKSENELIKLTINEIAKLIS
jgi:hypothetical protein